MNASIACVYCVFLKKCAFFAALTKVNIYVHYHKEKFLSPFYVIAVIAVA